MATRQTMPTRYDNKAKHLGGCCFWFVLWADRQTCAENDWSAGPVFERISLTLEPGSRTEAAGPFYSRQQKSTERLLVVSPLFSQGRDSGTETEEFDLLYPALTYDR